MENAIKTLEQNILDVQTNISGNLSHVQKQVNDLHKNDGVSSSPMVGDWIWVNSSTGSTYTMTISEFENVLYMNNKIVLGDGKTALFDTVKYQDYYGRPIDLGPTKMTGTAISMLVEPVKVLNNSVPFNNGGVVYFGYDVKTDKLLSKSDLYMNMPAFTAGLASENPMLAGLFQSLVPDMVGSTYLGGVGTYSRV